MLGTVLRPLIQRSRIHLKNELVIGPIQPDYVSGLDLADEPAFDGFGREVDRSGKLSRGARHSAIGHQCNTEALVL